MIDQVISETPPQPTFREHGVNIIRKHLRKMLSHADAVHSGEEIMAVHDMRVASRRLRAAISVFGPAFEGKSFERFENEVKAITDALSAARDLDVMVETLEKLDADLPENERGGLESLISELRDKRGALQKHVRKSLEHMHRVDLEGWFASICGTAESEEAEPEATTALPVIGDVSEAAQ